jgi:hypothetical protein
VVSKELADGTLALGYLDERTRSSGVVLAKQALGELHGG